MNTARQPYRTDCGDSGCTTVPKSQRTGMRTNGGCRCWVCPDCDRGSRLVERHAEWCPRRKPEVKP